MFFLTSFGMDSSMVLANCCAICATASCWDDDDDDEFAFTFGNSKFDSSGNCGKSIVPNGVSILFCCCLSSDEGTSVSTARVRTKLLLFAHPEARL